MFRKGVFAAQAGEPPKGTSADPATPQPDHAWKALSITNEWIRHADAKSGVTLAFAAATATALFNLVGRQEVWTRSLIIAAMVATTAVLAVSVCAVLALVPRVKRKRPRAATAEHITADDAVNLLFFGDVSRTYADDRPMYREVFGLLTADPISLTGHVADQIHANAHIATVKYRWANAAVRAELVAAIAVGAVALLIATGW